MKGVHIPWSDEDKAEFAIDWQTGVLVAELVRKYGRSKNSLSDMRIKLRLEPRPHGPGPINPTPDLVERIRAALAAHMPKRAVSKLVGISQSQLRTIADRFDAWPLPVAPPPAPPQNDRDAYGWEPLPAMHPVSWDAIRIGPQA